MTAKWYPSLNYLSLQNLCNKIKSIRALLCLMLLRRIACTFSLVPSIQKFWKRLQQSIRNFRFWILFIVHMALGHLGFLFSTCPLQPQAIGTYYSAKWDSQVIVQTQQMEFKVPILPWGKQSSDEWRKYRGTRTCLHEHQVDTKLTSPSS